jgi:hypothetical protein
MKKYIKTTVGRWVNLLTNPIQRKIETALLAQGKLLSNQQNFFHSGNINEYEFKIFSQRGEDGIIQYLIKHIQIKSEIFIEFGVENYMESNTRFLMMNNNWSGLVIDGSAANINSIRKREWFWKYDLKTQCAFIDKGNINTLLHKYGFKDIGILSIDIDGNDYWIFQEIDLSELNPSIVIIEYNGLFGSERMISVPYDKCFNRTKAHFTNLFFGASLAALAHLAAQKGYELIGCCDAGTNAFFVRKDLLNNKIRKLNVSEAYKEDKCRQSRGRRGEFSFLSGDERLSIIKGLNVVNVLTNEIEKL